MYIYGRAGSVHSGRGCRPSGPRRPLRPGTVSSGLAAAQTTPKAWALAQKQDCGFLCYWTGKLRNVPALSAAEQSVSCAPFSVRLLAVPAVYLHFLLLHAAYIPNNGPHASHPRDYLHPNDHQHHLSERLHGVYRCSNDHRCGGQLLQKYLFP